MQGVPIHVVGGYAGKFRGKSAEKYLNGYGLGMLTALDKVAAAVRATLAQVALAWLSAQPSAVVNVNTRSSSQPTHADIAAAALLALHGAGIIDDSRPRGSWPIRCARLARDADFGTRRLS